MKAISLWQPWASLVAVGAKPYETRSWPPPRALIGQTIAIHAAKKIDAAAAGLAESLMFGGRGEALGAALEQQADDLPVELMGGFGNAVLPIGCVVATARLEAAFRLGPRALSAVGLAARIEERMALRPMLEYVTVPIDDFGDYRAGRWAWLLRDVKALRPPVPARGAQGFFELPQGWLVPTD